DQVVRAGGRQLRASVVLHVGNQLSCAMEGRTPRRALERRARRRASNRCTGWQVDPNERHHAAILPRDHSVKHGAADSAIHGLELTFPLLPRPAASRSFAPVDSELPRVTIIVPTKPGQTEIKSVE